MKDVDVLIAGAGPTGMTAALALTRAGRQVTIIDKHPDRLAFSRALLINPHILSLLAPLGVTPLILERGTSIQGFRLYGEDGLLVSGKPYFQDIYPEFPPIKLAQRDTEQCLEDELRRHGVMIDRPAELIDLVQYDDHVIATTQRPYITNSDGTQDTTTPQIEKIRCQYLIGADGFHSRTRTLLGLEYPTTQLTQKMLGLDVTMDWPFAEEDVAAWILNEGFILAIRLNDCVRLVMAPASLINHLPKDLPPIQHIIQQSLFTITFAHVSHYGRDRVWLAGDAAHVHSPVGGRGMNLGIADGIALSDAIQSGDFAAYETRRLEIARAWIRQNRLMTEAVTLGGTWGHLQRHALRGAILMGKHVINRSLAKHLLHAMMGAPDDFV